MTSTVRTLLVTLALLSQLLGGVAVLCVEGDGSLLVELQLGDCCGSELAGSGDTGSVESTDVCDSCDDLALGVHDRDRGDAELGAVLTAVTAPPVVGMPLVPTDRAEPPPESHLQPEVLTPHAATVTAVTETVVLTC